MRFCPQCGVQTVPPARFCTECGVALSDGKQAPGARGAAPAPPPVPRQSLRAGLVVLSLYLAVGIGLWVFVLRSQPFPVVAVADGPASSGGSPALPQDHPPISIPEDVKQRIVTLVNEANATPDSAETWRRLAEVQFRASQLEASYRSAALSSYQHLLALVPDDPDALRGIGNVYYDFEEHSKAIDYYERYLALRPDDKNVRTDLGTMYLYTHQADRAVAEYRAVLAKNPDFFQAHFNLGIAYREKADFARARTSLERARALTDDERIRARVDRVLAQLRGGSPQTRPRTAFQRAVEQIFHSHDIMGSKVARIEWPAPAGAKVYLQNFPIQGMPPDVRERFLAKLRIQIGLAGKSNNIDASVRVELIDADTRSVMETLHTETS